MDERRVLPASCDSISSARIFPQSRQYGRPSSIFKVLAAMATGAAEAIGRISSSVTDGEHRSSELSARGDIAFNIRVIFVAYPLAELGKQLW
jgi:hypothetical protein